MFEDSNGKSKAVNLKKDIQHNIQKKMEHRNKQRSTNHTHKTKDPH